MIINIHIDKRKRCSTKDGYYHNSYGPDETYCYGEKTYCINNKFHNPYGPAAFYPSGNVGYWLDDKRCTKEEWEQLRYEY